MTQSTTLPRRRAVGGVVVLAVWVLACEAAPDPALRSSLPAPAQPASCREVGPGEDLQALLIAGPRAICLKPGVYAAPLTIPRPVTVYGPRDAVVTGAGGGTTLDVTADDAALLGFTVDAGGGRIDTMDAAVRVRASGVRVEGLLVRNAVFGLLVEASKRVVLRGNTIEGDPDEPVGLRGDGIRLWETTDSLVEHNVMFDSRDVVVWYASRNRIENNRVVRSRYGTHLMYSHENVIRNNRYESDVVGMFIMYSRDVRIEGNLIAGALGPGGMGLGLKESGNVTVANNRVIGNTLGVFLDASPIRIDEHNVFRGNEIALSQAGIVLHGSRARNRFEDNVLRDNGAHLEARGGNDALDLVFTGNTFDDYRGYDLDGDGIGDVPYQLKSMSGQLAGEHPDLAFFHGTPALWLLDVAGEALPIFQPRVLMVDERPRLSRRGPR